ncbi:MAG: heme ABC exporter ATP-binding protein CcmA [Alphaproteobacteria bacterium]|nr:heme ABC exporter ATP-binding protein CcmA [Alphaproteobacteria bacterium]
MRLEGRGLACVRGERELFAGVDFSLSEGELIFLEGPNGSGKSSFLRMIAGLLRPSSGSFLRDGALLASGSQDLQEQLIYVGHQDPVKPAFSVAENLIFWMGLAGRKIEYRRGRGGGLVTDGTQDALGALGIAALADIPARLLSAGQRRRLNLARLAAIPRPLWLLDEPTVGLDASGDALLAGLMSRHRASGGLVIVASHTDFGVLANRHLHFGQGRNP